jgi:mannose-1-phosphate guanylyltransferase/mannose-6-phosphate isomerase
MMKTYAVILAGGRGERFWPISRRDFPKQFLNLFGPESLVQMTSRRVAGVCPLPDQRFVVDPVLGKVLARQLKLTKRNFVYEPFGRNTAPAIALAAAYVAREDPDSVMAVLPADHLIEDVRAFQSALRFAAEVAGMGYLVTFGVKPERPDTGYGYIEVGDKLVNLGRQKAFRVKRFREKPDARTARRFVRQGNFWWNSGMFVWQTRTFLAAVEACMPDFYCDLMRFERAIGTRREKAELERMYRRVRPESVDYAIMEKSPNVAVIRAGFDWDDVGSWLALERHFPKDAEGNVALGECIRLDSRGCMTMSEGGLVALIGCEDLIVVRARDAVLVCRKDKAGEIKKLLAQMREDGKLGKCL